MIGRSHQDIYVAACGQPCDSRREGLDHERFCHVCLGVLAGMDDDGADDEPEPEDVTT